MHIFLFSIVLIEPNMNSGFGKWLNNSKLEASSLVILLFSNNSLVYLAPLGNPLMKLSKYI